MKKSILLFVCCFVGIAAFAQVTVKPGVRAGLNLANFTNTDFDTKADFYVGGLVAIKLAKFYTLQPELTYSRQGAKGQYYEYNDFNNFDPIVQNTYIIRDRDYSLQYVSLAVMNRFDIVQGFHGIVGPTLDFRVGDNFPDELGRELADVDFALNGGFGYTLPMGLTVEARYKLGLVDIFGYNFEDDYYNESSEDYDDIYLNSVFQIGVSYTF